MRTFFPLSYQIAWQALRHPMLSNEYSSQTCKGLKQYSISSKYRKRFSSDERYRALLLAANSLFHARYWSRWLNQYAARLVCSHRRAVLTHSLTPTSLFPGAAYETQPCEAFDTQTHEVETYWDWHALRFWRHNGECRPYLG